MVLSYGVCMSYGKWVQEKAVNDVVLNVQAVDWYSWQERYCKQLKHVVGFEKAFVQNILMNVPNLAYSDVIPQYHFIDDKGGNRYIDFMIINQAKGYCLPIELDGYSKMVGNGEEYHKFNDFLERQNSIIKQFGLVLRYSNKKMLNEADSIINEISHTLNLQANNKSTQAIKEQQVSQLMATYDQQIKELKQQNNHEFGQLIQELRQEITHLKEQQVTEPVEPLPTPLPQVNKDTDTKWIIAIVVGLVVVGVLGVLSYLSINKQRPMPVTQKNVQEPEYKAPTVTYETKPSPLVVTQEQEQVQEQPVKPKPQPSKQESKPVKEVKEVKETPKPAKATSEYVEGTHQQMCGKVAGYKEFAKGVYLNLDGMYPRHKASITVWNAKEPEVYHLYDEYVCATGKVEFYKGKPRVSVQSVNQVSVR